MLHNYQSLSNGMSPARVYQSIMKSKSQSQLTKRSIDYNFIKLKAAVNKEYGTRYIDKVAYQDSETRNVTDYSALTNSEVIFKKMGEKSDYIIQPKAMLKRGTYCVTELYSAQTRRILVERLIQDRMKQRSRTRKTLFKLDRTSAAFLPKNQGSKRTSSLDNEGKLSEKMAVLDDIFNQQKVNLGQIKDEIDKRSKMKEFLYYKNKLERQLGNQIWDESANSTPPNESVVDPKQKSLTRPVSKQQSFNILPKKMNSTSHGIKNLISKRSALTSQNTQRTIKNQQPLTTIDEQIPSRNIISDTKKSLMIIKQSTMLDTQRLKPEVVNAVVDRRYLTIRERNRKSTRSFIVSNEVNMYAYHKNADNPLMKKPTQGFKIDPKDLQSEIENRNKSAERGVYDGGWTDRQPRQEKVYRQMIQKRLIRNGMGLEKSVDNVQSSSQKKNIQKLSKIIAQCMSERKNNDAIYSNITNFENQIRQDDMLAQIEGKIKLDQMIEDKLDGEKSRIGF